MWLRAQSTIKIVQKGLWTHLNPSISSVNNLNRTMNFWMKQASKRAMHRGLLPTYILDSTNLKASLKSTGTCLMKPIKQLTQQSRTLLRIWVRWLHFKANPRCQCKQIWRGTTIRNNINKTYKPYGPKIRRNLMLVESCQEWVTIVFLMTQLSFQLVPSPVFKRSFVSIKNKVFENWSTLTWKSTKWYRIVCLPNGENLITILAWIWFGKLTVELRLIL